MTLHQKLVKLVLPALLLFFSTAQMEAMPIKATQTITHPEYGMQIDCPSSWRHWASADEGEGWTSNTYVGFYGLSIGGMTLAGGHWAEARTFDEFASWYQPANPAIVIKERQVVTINGCQWLQLFCDYNDGSRDLNLLMFCTVNGTQGYNISFFASPSAYQRASADFNAAIHSLRFL